MTLSLRTRFIYLLLACALLTLLALPVLASASAGYLGDAQRTGTPTLVDQDTPPVQIACTGPGGHAQGSCGGG